MGMLSTAINFQLFDHGVAQGTLGQHAFNRFFQRAAWVFGLHIAEIGLANTAWITRVAVVDLVEVFIARYADFGRVDDDNEITCIDVRGLNGYVFTTQAGGYFAGNATQYLIGGINHKPLMNHLCGFSASSAHSEFSFNLHGGAFPRSVFLFELERLLGG